MVRKENKRVEGRRGVSEARGDRVGENREPELQREKMVDF